MIICTGGSGFLGSHLCDRLLKDGNYVICLDNFYTGHQANIEHLSSNKYFEVIEHDVTNPIKIDVDEIYNFAMIMYTNQRVVVICARGAR